MEATGGGSRESPRSETGDEMQSENECSSVDSGEESEREKELSALAEEQKKLLDEYLLRIRKLEQSCETLCHSQKELEIKLDQAVRLKDVANKEKESMVMKYAVSEKNIIETQLAKEKLERKCKEALREMELQQHKLASMASEKTRLCNMYDSKCHELKSSQQELDRTKADLSALETKLKWSQNSLKNEIELRKDCESKLDGLNAKVQECTSEVEKTKRDAVEAMREFHASQENRAHVLDQQVKELQASIILLRHERDESEHHNKRLHEDFERLQKKQNDTLKENNDLSMKVQQLEKDRSELEQKLSELRNCADQQRQDAAELNAKRAQLEQLKLQLKSEQEQLSAATEQINLLKQRNTDLSADMESCRAHEAELLSFTHQLTDKNVRLQSEFTAMETKVQQLTCEHSLLKRAAKEQETKAALLSTQILEQRNKFTEDNNRLTTDLNDKRKLCDDLTQQVADQKGENSIIKRKLELSLREVNKELAQCRKKIEQYEISGTGSSSSSSSSLNGVDRVNGSPTPSMDQVKVVQPERELDRQALIEHIVKLQRISARKSEKLDFLEEHVNTLVAELQKKSRLLQSYVLREQTGTLSSNTMDHNKANIAKYSGVMASVYGAKVADENLTLELSLDINRKLQAVLEDALLENITLKKNVDTLGEEIDRLLKKNMS